jgi:hypothetical protein
MMEVSLMGKLSGYLAESLYSAKLRASLLKTMTIINQTAEVRLRWLGFD